jgi:hypothetical protein
MRGHLLLGLALLLPVAACSSGSDTADADQAVTDGYDDVEPSTVFLFASMAASENEKIAPACLGAMLSTKMAVTLRSCAKEGMVVGRAANKQGRGKRATVKTVHVPKEGEIAVVELDRELPGDYALVTTTPLRAVYRVNGRANVDGGFGWYGAEEGDGSEVNAFMVSESAASSTLQPLKEATICASDVGAPVCSTWSTDVFDVAFLPALVGPVPIMPVPVLSTAQTCGLSALVLEAGAPAPVEQGKAAPPAGCSHGPARVVRLGDYADFLRGLAPGAFQPYVKANWVPYGLWGHKTAGTIQSCKIETESLPGVEAKKDLRLKASAKFAMMDDNARAYGQFGLAPKADPAKVEWYAAKASKTQGDAFDATFEGMVTPQASGEFIVAFRASPNGETWSICEKDGTIARAIDPAKALTVTVGGTTTDGSTPTGSTPGPTPGATPGSTPGTTPGTTPGATPSPTPDAPPVVTTGGSDDSTGSDDSSSPTEETGPAKFTPKKKKKASEDGCSASPQSGAANAGTFGLLLGLAAFTRRGSGRRRR